MMTTSYKWNAGTFRSKDANPEETLLQFNKYVEMMADVFQLRRHRMAMGEPVNFTVSDKKALMKVEGGDNMHNLFRHTGKVMDDNT